ncbi:MAG: DNA helicase/exodeoxyribonuclease V, subunit B [Magnetococcales bacterium]|nr:DNA helicase/exodeoxyribonuclease V, subunit B [Magnetococcales bacterium]HIJ83162.1 hypothetical protein [Magnetococcales bacterium]
MVPSALIQGIEALGIHLERGHVLVTVNQRLSRHLTGRLNTYQASKGNKVWLTAEIIPLQAWLRKMWLEYLDRQVSPGQEPPRLLSDLAQRCLWERVVAEDSRRKKKVLWPRQTAVLAQKGWEQLLEWRLQSPVAESQGHEDTQAFVHWVEIFGEQARRGGMIFSNQLMGFLENHLDHLHFPPGIILAGFDSWSPATAHFFSLLQDRGVDVAHYVPESFACSPVLQLAIDHEAEIRCAAQWAKQWVERKGDSLTPDQTVGIIHPVLHQWRNQVIRIFTEVFYPGSLEWNALPDAPAFNLSLGFPLTDSPLIADALFFLHLCRDGVLTAADVGRFLHSPHCAGGRGENSARALLDVQWREKGWQRISFKELSQRVNKNGKTPILARMLGRLARLDPRHEWFSPTRPSQWPVRFSQILALMGWPGEGSLASTDFQLIETWKEMLGSLAGLETITPRMDYSQALAILVHAAGEHVFQPEGGQDAPVQILGSLEAEGETFAALWIMGLSDDVWPPRPDPNPFLPREFQRRHGMPRSSSEREYEFAARITRNLLGAAPVVVVSSPQRDGDMELRISPFLRGLDQVQETVADPPDFVHQVLASGRLEKIVADSPPPCPDALPPCSIGVLKAQSLCPFQAFARYRLLAKPLPVAQAGLSPALRGQITHRALAGLLVPGFSMKHWRTLAQDHREAVIGQACTQALEEEMNQQEVQVPQGLLILERERQIGLLRQWMEVEGRRGADFTVLAVETCGTLPLDRLTLSYRMDRIDRLENDDRVIIDYKTGRVNMGDWFGERPRDPQMPIYALALEERMAAMVYGVLSRKEKRFIGLAEQSDVLPGVAWLKGQDEDLDATDFLTLKEHWRQIVAQVAREFVQGEARVDPQARACDLCDLQPLCRIDEPTQDFRHDIE